VTLTVIYLVFITIMLLHGLVIWQDLATRILAIMSGVLVLGLTVVILWRDALKTRAVIELRDDQRPGEQSVLNVTTAGHLANANIQLVFRNGEQTVQGAAVTIRDFSALTSVKAALPAVPFDEIKVWVHRITPEEVSEAMPAQIEIYTGEESHIFHLDQGSGIIQLPVKTFPCRVHIGVLARDMPQS
jgi:ABC-type nickel/cobalt efflux system permease component RcnA